MNNSKSKKMKHYRIKNKFRFITFITIFMLVVSFGFSSIFGLGSVAGSDVIEYVNVKVQDGDTLWDLAKEYGPKNTDIRRVIYEITKINNINADSLQSGMYISIPCSNI